MSFNIQQNQPSNNSSVSGNTNGFFSNLLIKKFLDILKSVSRGHHETSGSSHFGNTNSSHTSCNNGSLQTGSSKGSLSSKLTPPPRLNGTTGNQASSSGQLQGGPNMQGSHPTMGPPPLGNTGATNAASNGNKTQNVPASNSPDNTKSTYVYDSKHAPTGDYKISYTGATKGKIYLDKPVVSAGNSVGATSQGAWFNKDATGKSDGTYDTTKKISVEGAVSWPNAKNSDTVSADGNTRTIKTNALPTGTTTGVFPVSTSSAAGKIDPNPNTIKVQDITLVVPTHPKVNAKATAVSTGPIGITTNGIPIFNATDESGKGAVANEVQDSNGTHPQQSGIDHVHNISSSLLSTLLKNDPTKTGVVGYALDGFPITGPGTGSSELFTKDLDANHGTTGTYTGADGKVTSGYHYVATQDFPYTVGAFAGTPSTLQGYKSLG